MAARQSLAVFAEYLKTTWHWDLGAGALVGAGIGYAGTFKSVRADAITLLIAETAIGAALLAVVLAALAVFVTFFDAAYRTILEKAHDGALGEAFRPYVLVGVIGGLDCICALVSAIVWPKLGADLQDISLGISTWMTAWTVFGSISLLSLTAWHGSNRAQLMGTLEKARELRSRSAATRTRSSHAN